jgi:hypothetical protein
MEIFEELLQLLVEVPITPGKGHFMPLDDEDSPRPK